MKKYITNTIILCALFTVQIHAQWTDGGSFISTNDNVGVGGQTNAHSLYVRTDKAGWQGAFINRQGNIGANVYLAHGSGYGMHIRGRTVDGKYTLDLYNRDRRTNIFYNNGIVGLGLVGNVGIGTASPAEKLHVNGNMRANIITAISRRVNFGSQYFYGDNNSAMYFTSNHNTLTRLILRDKQNRNYGQLYGTGDGAYFGLLDADGNWSYLAAKDNYTSFRINGKEKMRITTTGNIGIGTNTPNYKLHVNGKARSNDVIIGGGLDDDGGYGEVTGVQNLFLTAANAGNVGGNIFFKSGQAQLMTLLKSGKLQIGSVNTSSNDYKLFVQKGILTEKVRVAVSSTSDWADFVFEDNYQLMPLSDLKSFITVNHHLPGVPTADEVVKDGIDLAKTNALLLKKIEESYLYILELNQEVENMKAEISELKDKQ